MSSLVQPVAVGVTNNSLTVAATLGSAATAGSRLVAVLTTNRSITNGQLPAGWTEIGRLDNTAGCNLIVGELVATGGETTITCTAADGNSRMLLTVYELDGVDAADASSSFNASSGAVTSHTVPSATGPGILIAALSLDNVITSSGAGFAGWSDGFGSGADQNNGLAANNPAQSTAMLVVTDATSHGPTQTWTVSAAAVGAMLLFPESAGSTPSGGSSVDVAVTTAGTGVKVATGGSSVDVTVSTTGVGEKHSTGGSSVDVAVSTSGTGSKHVTGGSTSTVDASTSSAGHKETSGGSGVSVDVSVASGGLKSSSGGSSVDVAVTEAGSGEKIAAGGSSVDVTVTTSGSGTNPGGAPQGGSTVDVTVSTSGTGSKRATGGSTAAVGASTDGTGHKESSGGSDVSVSVSVTSAGQKSSSGGSSVDATVSESGTGVKAGAGGSEATIVVSVTGGGSNPGDRDRDVLVVARVTPHAYRAEISPQVTYAAEVAPRDELAAVVAHPTLSADLETVWSASVSKQTRQIYIGTTEYLVVNVSANVDLGDQAVSISFDGTTFATASWVGSTASTRRAARLLLDAANTPAAGEHPVYVKLDDGVEVPIIYAGRVIVIDPTA